MVRFSSFNSRAAQKGKRTLKGLDNFDVCVVVVAVSFSFFCRGGGREDNTK